mmetsp:Transcript_13592/g.59312  ORF Transcript_13592/g.59312 Transcript_13592/m.59312 type:complete len:273 (+) Transcript_13592:2599-3417(+)
MLTRGRRPLSAPPGFRERSLAEDAAGPARQTPLQRVEVQFRPVRLAAVAGAILLELLRDLVGHDVQVLARAHRQNLHLAASLEIVHVVERLGHARSAHDDAVVGVEQDALTAHHLHQPVPLLVVQHQAVKDGIVRHLVEESERILVAHAQPEPLGAAQRGGVGLVRVKDARHAGLVDRLVDEESGGVDRPFALQHVPGVIQQEEVARRDLGPQKAVRDTEEPVGGARDHDGEVVAYPLVHVHLIAQVIARGEVDARLPHERVVSVGARPISR